MTAKNCTKKCDARCVAERELVVFVPVPVPVPVGLFKLPNKFSSRTDAWSVDLNLTRRLVSYTTTRYHYYNLYHLKSSIEKGLSPSKSSKARKPCSQWLRRVQQLYNAETRVLLFP